MGLGDAGQVSLAVATFSSSTDDPPCITGTGMERDPCMFPLRMTPQ